MIKKQSRHPIKNKTTSHVKPRFAALVFSSLLLSSCATLSKQECMTGNWQTIGFNDGVAGHYADRLALHSKACAKAGVAPDYKAWEQGRQEGLKRYCTAANAYAVGKRGSQLNNVCPAPLLSSLQNANRAGREYYALSNQLKEEEKQLDEYLEQYKKLRAGESLNFKTEADARRYLLTLPNKITQSRLRINHAKQRLATLDSTQPY